VSGGLGIVQLSILKILSPRNYYSTFLVILEVFEKELEEKGRLKQRGVSSYGLIF
jgi:hypothetical protein